MPGRRSTEAAAAALLLALLAPAQERARGALSLKDGRFVIGKPISAQADGVVVHFDHGQVKVPMAMVRDYFSTAVDFTYEPKNEREASKLERGLVPFNGVWIKRERAVEKLQEIQDAMHAKIAAQKSDKRWMNRSRVETRSFKFEHNLPDHLFDELKELFEVYHAYFMKYWRKKTDLPHKPTVYLYADAGDFHQISGAPGGVLGWYHLFNNTLHVYWDRTDPELTIDVLFHEANHMLADMINGRFRYPHWIEEPMAEYYGASEWDPATKKMKTGRVQAGRLAEIKSDIADGEWWTIKKLIHNQSYRSYTWGWSFIHFMMESPKYEKKWKKFYLELAHKSQGIKRVMEGPFRTVEPDELESLLLKYLGHKQLDTLEKEWHQFVGALDVQELEGYERAGRKLRTMPGKSKEAREYLEKAVAMGAKNPFTYAALASLLEQKGLQSRALEVVDKAIELDPLEPELYYLKGKVLRQAGSKQDEAEAKRYFQLASEIEPDSWTYATAAAEMGG